MPAPDGPGAAGPAGPAPSAETPDAEVYGLLRLAGAVVALPLSALREVVPRPPELAALPVRAPDLLGALQLRSLVVPVLDVRGRLGLPVSDSGAGQVVVVVGAGALVVGVVADEVLGITTVPAADLLDLRAPAPRLVGRTFRDPVRAEVVGVLDPEALLALPDVPSVRALDRGAAAQPAQVDGLLGSRRRLTLLRCGPYVLGLDSRHVHTLLPPLTAQPSVLAGPLCTGVTTYAGREVAVVDPLALLGLGALPADRIGGGVVLSLGGGHVVVAVTSLLDLVEVPAEDVLPLPAFAVRSAELLSGLLDTATHGQCLVLDGNVLVAHHEIVTLAGLNTLLGEQPERPTSPGTPPGRTALSEPVGAREPEVSTGSEGPTLRPTAYLAYTAGTDLVTRLEQVVEILPVPTTSTPTGAHPAVLGVVVHRRAAVPLICLPTLLGSSRSGRGTPCALLVHVDGAPLALVVDALRSIEPLAWQDPAGGERGSISTPVELLHASPLVQVGDGGQLLRDLDLHQLGRLVLAGGVPGAAASVPAPRQPSTVVAVDPPGTASRPRT